MRILHVYQKEQPQLAHYVDSLTAAMGKDMECAIATDAREAEERCREWQPHIVHVHGDMGLRLPRTARMVVTPHGKSAQRRAYVVIARSRMERDRLQQAGHQRIEVVRNPIITRTTTFANAVAQFSSIYRRVMDSNVRQLMNADTLGLLRVLLKVGIMGDSRWAPTTLPQTSLTATDWRQLQIYAWLEGVADIVKRGASLLTISLPALDVSTVRPFLPDGFVMPQPTDESDVASLLSTIDDEMGHHQLSLHRITALHQALVNPLLDEEKLLQSLDKKMLLLLRRLLHIAHEETLLDEGFMPDVPLADHTTTNIQQLLNNHQLI